MRRVLTIIFIAAIGVLPLPATAQTTTHTCFGEPATLVGTAGNDVLRGDVLVGLGGRDELHGRLVCAGKGDDGPLSGGMVDAGPGDDPEVRGGALVIGGPGNDEFFDFGTSGVDRQVWRGGPGSDVYNSDEGDDVFYGGEGNDVTGDDQDWGALDRKSVV